MITATGEATERAAGADRGEVRRAIVLTLAYADLFDYPLRRAEIHRYLLRCAASRESVDDVLDHGGSELVRHVERTGPYFHLSGRSAIVALRERRAQSSARLWPVARRFARAIAALPLVRAVAISGALAMDNADEHDDIDLFVLAQPGRVWLCRLLVVAIVRLAGRRGVRLCPNFVLSTDRLELTERNLYTAHELVQLVPTEPTVWHRRFVEANAWADLYLPNARGAVRGGEPDDRPQRLAPRLAPLGTRLLSSRLFDGLERWERRRKIRRLAARARSEGGSVAFSADECRGHFTGHDRRVLAEFAVRASRLEPTA